MKKIAVVGATGLVGRTILKSLYEEGVAFDELYLFSSRKSAGQKVMFGEIEYTVSELTSESFDNLDIDVTLMSAGSETSKKFAKDILKGSRYLIDNSSAFRKDPSIPLVVPEVNFDSIAKLDSQIIANPNCSTIQLVIPLYFMNKLAPIEKIIVTALQSVSGSGIKAVEELKEQSVCSLNGKKVKPEVYSDPIAFNLIPRIGDIGTSGYCEEEIKIMSETNKILATDISICATTVRVPVFYCHSESVYIEFSEKVEKEEIIDLFNKTDSINYYKDEDYPMPINFSGRSDVYVGRLRNDMSNSKKAYKFWIVADNLKRGAATNAVRIAKKLLD
ncbi:aspartate-semialdehyde dehydrogenase [bacterium]|nr:aspartate-semialdehyde dehydrogenase [bacterium]